MKEKILNFIDKALEEAVKIAMGFSGGLIVTSCFTFANIQLSLPIYIVLYLASGIGTYKGMSYLENRLKDAQKRELHQTYQLYKSMDEVFKKDNEGKVNAHTTVFISKIEDKAGDFQLPSTTYNAINQFLYMINENYYDLILENYEALSREFLVDKLLTEIVKYLRKYNQTEFDERDIDEILEPFFFIPPKIKDDIYKEFKAAKRRIYGENEYFIISKNVTEEMLEHAIFDNEPITKTDVFLGRLNIDNYHTYEYLIFELGKNEYNEFGDFSKLEWDIEFLKEVITTMVYEFAEDIKNEVGTLDEFEVAVSFITNAGYYAMLNRCSLVDIKVIMNTFKGWEYLSTNLKAKIAKFIVQELGLGENLYPYFEINTEKNPTKIIEFPRNNNDK